MKRPVAPVAKQRVSLIRAAAQLARLRVLRFRLRLRRFRVLRLLRHELANRVVAYAGISHGLENRIGLHHRHGLDFNRLYVDQQLHFTVLCRCNRRGRRGRALGDRNRSSRRSLGGLRRHREVRGFVPRRLLLFAKQRGARRAKRS